MDFLEAVFPSESPRVAVADSRAAAISKESAVAYMLKVGLLTAEELARAKGVHLRTIYKWADRAADHPEDADVIRRLIGAG